MNAVAPPRAAGLVGPSANAQATSVCDDRRVAIILDHAVEENGVAYFYDRFFSFCERRRLRPIVIGDSPALRVDHAHIRYHASKRLPRDLLTWSGPHGLASRPFIALGAARPQGADAGAQAILRAQLAQKIGGAQVALLDSLARRSWLAEVATELYETLARRRVQRVYLPTQSFLGFAAAKAVARLAGIEVVHGVHTDYPGFFFERLMKAADVSDPARFLSLRTAMYQRIATRALSSGNEILFPSAAALSVYRPHLRTDGRYDTNALRGGVDAQRFRPRWPRRASRRWVAAYFGRLEHDKNAAMLPAIASLVAGVDAWRVIGDGSLRGELEAAMRDAEFVGHMSGERLVQELQSVDACVFPSIHDTFALAVLEVMACGVPVIVTDAGGPASYVHHERTGLVVPATALALGGALSRLQAEPELAAALSRNGRLYAQSQTWHEVFTSLAGRLFGPLRVREHGPAFPQVCDSPYHRGT